MAAPVPRVAPDGVLLDHVAELAYEGTPRLQMLFRSDEEGYIYAVAQLVQTIASGGIVIGASQPGALEPTDKLKAALLDAGRLEFHEFFAGQQRMQQLALANTWLAAHW